MNFKRIFVLGFKLIALTLILFICFSVASVVVGIQSSSAQDTDQSKAALALLSVCFLNTIVLAYPILRSKWRGLKLTAVVFVVLFGVQTFMSQMETWFFGSAFSLSSSELLRIILMGAVTAILYSPLAVLILGKMKRSTDANIFNSNRPLAMSFKEWIWKLIVIAISYVIIYFVFGYFVAWQSPALRKFYSGSTELLGFFPHMLNQIATQPDLIIFQFFRGLIWVALAMPIIRMMKGEKFKTALAIGLLFGVLMSSQLLLPNQFMPEPVRMMHLLETSTSNFVFGFLIVYVLNYKISSKSRAY